ncbi:hypothetical protein QF035_011023 [Streptomyces umbrinus]|uniref:Uncharacterized protein n=1 Tax=Streptomyces umbrinus TaxID=67370 RepID=A0ABU0TC94_9ACTN|nr:hypothetical protein [Streptomyces umbrinus]MDQ1033441.1 hypothetical protein [Streptomyces umbrinus]
MEPYDAFDAIDPFTAATRAFDCLKGALAGPESAALSHHELEDLVGLQGRELLRLLFQGHLDRVWLSLRDVPDQAVRL